MAACADSSGDPQAITIPEGHYRLIEGAEVMPFIPSGELWEATIRVCTQESVGVVNRVPMRRGLTGFFREGDWCVVEAMTVPLLVRIDDLSVPTTMRIT